MSRPVHFEIQADDPNRAIDFYETALGWSFTKAEGEEYWSIETGPSSKPGINGALIPRKGPPPPVTGGVPLVGYVVTVEVGDLDTMLHAVNNAGGSIVVPASQVAGIGRLAYAKDTEGNIFGLRKSAAAKA
ncbi:MAG: VOC family protein [Hyphomicrobiaceae bacterium]|nr:MAG: VOC family protein [Hyphomicrobiaceae bacterium]